MDIAAKPKATIRGGAPYVWSVILLSIEDATGLDVVDWVADETFLTTQGATMAGLLLVGLLLNIVGMARAGGWLERVIKILPGLPEYTDPPDPSADLTL